MRCFTIVFDCCCTIQAPQYDAFRRAVYEQCKQLLSLAVLSGTPLAKLTVRLYLVRFDVVELCEPRPGDGDDADHPWRSVLRRIVLHGDPSMVPPTAIDGLTLVRPLHFLIQQIHALQEDSAVDHLLLFCSTYVSLEQAVPMLPNVSRTDDSPQVVCLLSSLGAIAVSSITVCHRMCFYRCSLNPQDVQCVLQSCLPAFLLPRLYTKREVRLRVGDDVVQCRLLLPHHVDATRRCCTIDDIARPSVEYGGGYFAGASVLTCPTERARARAAPAEFRVVEPACELRLAAALTAASVDELMLCGDTWMLAWCGEENVSREAWAASYVRFRTLLRVFSGDALVFTGSAESALSPLHIARPQHHFLVRVVGDMMQLREIVPTEFHHAPLMLPPPSVGLPQIDPQLEHRLRDQRTRIVHHCTSADFSLWRELRADLDGLVQKVHPGPEWEMLLSRDGAGRSDSPVFVLRHHRSSN